MKYYTNALTFLCLYNGLDGAKQKKFRKILFFLIIFLKKFFVARFEPFDNRFLHNISRAYARIFLMITTEVYY